MGDIPSGLPDPPEAANGFGARLRGGKETGLNWASPARRASTAGAAPPEQRLLGRTKEQIARGLLETQARPGRGAGRDAISFRQLVQARRSSTDALARGTPAPISVLYQAYDRPGPHLVTRRGGDGQRSSFLTDLRRAALEKFLPVHGSVSTACPTGRCRAVPLLSNKVGGVNDRVRGASDDRKARCATAASLDWYGASIWGSRSG